MVAIRFGPGRPAESPDLATAVAKALKQADKLLVDVLDPWTDSAHIALDFVSSIVAAPGRLIGERTTAAEAAKDIALLDRFKLFPVLYAEPATHPAVDVLQFAMQALRPPPRELERELRAEESLCLRAVGKAMGNAHALGFGSVRWGGQTFGPFTTMQAAVIRVLWEHFEQGTPDIAQAEILEAIDPERSSEIEPTKLRSLFQDSDAWGVLIVQSRKGLYRLTDPVAMARAEKK